ncbi:uncharacterized protein LOC130667337 [Microplitis mediator]|uniref:uncharacterized protein LOC130667337 n=1 Tax=Microplitis mediator TaxID=375433 RepID=UPI002555F549|nr:uncharacterized protein LOC130667337 [Microplitis mediator]
MKETEKIITSLKAKILNVEIKITAWLCNVGSQQSSKERRSNTCVLNFTDVQLPKEVESILNLEPGFGIPLTPRQVPVGVLIKDLENGLRFVDIAGSDLKTVKEEQNNIRSKAVYLISNYYRRNRRKQSTRITTDFKTTKYFLKEHSDLIITRSDKDGNTVIMYEEEYLKEMYKLLEDKDTYLHLNKDPTSKYEKMANDLVAKLKRNLIISEGLEKEFKSYNSVSPKLYGLRKTHKPGCVMRPVVSSIKSPCYKIARFLHQILSTSLASKFVFSIKNSFEFVKFIKEVKLPKDYVLVSLDVVALFTNISKQLVKDIINEDWHELAGLIKIPKDMLLEVIQFCFDSSYLQFNGTCYQQLDGSSMGNPASPILANIVMDHILKRIMKLLPFPVPFLKVYVDDTILSIPEDKVDSILDIFNSVNKKIQFTMEIEKENRLPFLDVVVIRKDDGSLLTDWYIKPTSSVADEVQIKDETFNKDQIMV